MSSGSAAAVADNWPAQPRELRTPVGHGATLIDPPPSLVGELLAANRRRLSVDREIQGRKLVELRSSAQRELLAAATAATRQYADVPAPPADGPVFVAGHQPGLFHAGVWFKNVVLGRLAAAHGGAAINLQIDGDRVKSTSIRVPTGTIEEPVALALEFDAAGGEAPWEERSILDAETFESFGGRAAAAIAPFVPEPLIKSHWPRAVARQRATDNLGACLAQSRHQWELGLGLQTWELPHSNVSSFEAQRWLLADLLARAEEFREVHNLALAEYRAQYHVRSARHPVSELAATDGWIEAPLWVWTAAEARRRRLFVRRGGQRLRLSDRAQLELELPLGAGGDLQPTVARLAELAAGGVKIRTRALLTTLFARLLLADAFIHGIGGGKYDRLTDVLIGRFYGLEPPEFLVVTATLQLPIDRPPAAAEQLRDIDNQLRDLVYHPEQRADRGGFIAQALAAEKQRWIETSPDGIAARTRCHAIRRLNESLAESLAAERGELRSRRDQTQRRLRAEAVLGSREYAYCLFPETELRHFLLEIPARSP